MGSKTIIISLIFLGLLFTGHAHAHSPLCSCFDNGDGTVACEGGFSDGSSAIGKTDRLGTFVFKKPAVGDYVVVLDAGDEHALEISSKDILK